MHGAKNPESNLKINAVFLHKVFFPDTAATQLTSVYFRLRAAGNIKEMGLFSCISV